MAYEVANCGAGAAEAADPRTWSVEAWAADAVPHVAYGVGVVFAYEALAR